MWVTPVVGQRSRLEWNAKSGAFNIQQHAIGIPGGQPDNADRCTIRPTSGYRRPCRPQRWMRRLFRVGGGMPGQSDRCSGPGERRAAFTTMSGP